MRRALIAMVFLNACAFRRIERPDGYVSTEWAIGPQAKIARCQPIADHEMCTGVTTGWFSAGFAGVLEAAATAVGAYFGLGG